MTPFGWTRGRPRATAASLLVNSSAHILKWQEPASASVEANCRVAAGLKESIPHSVEKSSARVG